MSLDPRFVLCPGLQEQFWDKDLDVPLAGGIVTFYEDNSRTALKNVYTLNGNGPYSTASYVPIPNPVILSSVGTFIDGNGNDIVPYLFPYDGVPTDTTNTVDLYYITVYSAQGVLQFTREAWPNTTNTVVNVNEVTNFIPNGQFLLHNNDPVVNSNITVPAGSGTAADVSLIAQGGWSFQVPHGTSSVNSVSFVTNPISANPDATSSPRYSLNVACTVSSSLDTFKDICIQFPDVNKFASNSIENNYTFSFQAINLQTSLNVEVRLLKSFGTGGSPSPSTDTAFGVGTVAIQNSTTPTIYNIPGLFGNNGTATLGTNNDDYVQIAIRFPNQLFNVTLSDFVLTNGNVTLMGFPVETNAEMISPSTIGFLPVVNDGSDLYLPTVKTPTGMQVDYSSLGDIVAKSVTYQFTNSISTIGNELLCDGNQYQYSAYSPLGIPYSRLANVIFDSTSGSYRWGSGANWVNTYVSTGSTTQLIITTNKVTTAQTAPADSAGATATGFTFGLNSNPGVSSAYNYKAYANSSAVVTSISTFTTGTHSGNAVAAGTSGMSVASITNPASTVGYYAFQVTALSASSLSNTGSAAKYFTFSGNSTNDYYVWFVVSNETDPAPGGTGIKCQLTSTMSAADVAAVLAAVLSGYQENPITITGQPTNGAGSYWTFHSNGTQTAVWYQINGAGAAPAISSNVMVAINDTDTAAQIVTKTQNAINQAYFATPNYQDMFLRGTGTASNSIWGDVDQGTRFALNSMLASTGIGTFEIGQIVNHLHSGSSLTATLNITGEVNNAGSGQTVSLNGMNHGQNANFPGSVTMSGNTGLTGGSESRPANAYVTWAIKY